LPAEQRNSLVLAYYGGLSHAEIAQQLGRPLGTVKSWLRRSMQGMRVQLAAEVEG
jgi:RNA polymerase sigma-70 factor (ECF subfamily)